MRDYYLNNILIHELGHLVDSRNTGYVDRERYAEWFAVEYGYKQSRPSGPPKRSPAGITSGPKVEVGLNSQSVAGSRHDGA